MSAMSRLHAELSEDFENLTETSMQFKGVGWEKQEDRFNGNVNYDHAYIYWFENYASLILGRRILQDLGEPYEVLFDDACAQYAVTTDFATLSWLM